MPDLHVTVQQIQDSNALLKNGTVEFELPLQYLPKNLQVGQNIVLSTNPQGESGGDEYENMRKLLEELIN